MEERYLVQGITAMSRAMEDRWMRGHTGAAVICAYFFCAENDLDPRTAAAIHWQIDNLIAVNETYFRPQPKRQSDPQLIERIAASAAGNVSKFCRSGHNVIYAALILKALKRIPAMLTSDVADGMCRLLESFNDKEEVTDQTIRADDGIPEYSSHRKIAEFTFGEITRNEDHLWEHQGISGHFVNHAQSLIVLAEVGFPTLAKSGYDAHKIHAKWARMQYGKVGTTRTPIEPIACDPLTPEYWQSPLQDDDWAAGGHFFKYCYHFYDMLKLVPDPKIKQRVVRELRYLLQFRRPALIPVR